MPIVGGKTVAIPLWGVIVDKKSTAKFTDGSTDLKKNDRRLWKSRSGHIICFDDTDGKESVQIWDKSHKLCIALDTKEGNIFVTNNNNDINDKTENTYLPSQRLTAFQTLSVSTSSPSSPPDLYFLNLIDQVGST